MNKYMLEMRARVGKTSGAIELRTFNTELETSKPCCGIEFNFEHFPSEIDRFYSMRKLFTNAISKKCCGVRLVKFDKDGTLVFMSGYVSSDSEQEVSMAAGRLLVEVEGIYSSHTDGNLTTSNRYATEELKSQVRALDSFRIWYDLKPNQLNLQIISKSGEVSSEYFIDIDSPAAKSKMKSVLCLSPSSLLTGYLPAVYGDYNLARGFCSYAKMSVGLINSKASKMLSRIEESGYAITDYRASDKFEVNIKLDEGVVQAFVVGKGAVKYIPGIREKLVSEVLEPLVPGPEAKGKLLSWVKSQLGDSYACFSKGSIVVMDKGVVSECYVKSDNTVAETVKYDDLLWSVSRKYSVPVFSFDGTSYHCAQEVFEVERNI